VSYLDGNANHFLAFMMGACPQAADSGLPVYPEIMGFTFTPSTELQAGTLAVTGGDGLKNKTGTTITVSPGASLTINGSPYTPEP
jgi:hypothetical protein